MSGRIPAYPEPVRQYVLAQVVDTGAKIRPTVAALNRGDVEHLGVVPVSYSVARGWVADETAKRDAAAPLNDREADEYNRRLWAIGKRELRKLERDAAKSKPIDSKRLNDLAAFAQRMGRTLAPQDTQPPVAQDPDAPESMLDRLAREDRDSATQDQSSAAASTPTSPIPTGTSTPAEHQAAETEPKAEIDQASPVQVAA